MMEPRKNIPTYDDLDIPKTMAYRWQQAASLPEDLFENYLADTKAKHEEITSAAVLALAKALRQDVDSTPPVQADKHFKSTFLAPRRHSISSWGQ